MGGFDGRDQLDEVVEIDPVSGVVRTAGRLAVPRELATAASDGDAIYVFGGSDDDGEYLDSVERFVPGGMGVIVGRLPTPRTRSRAVTYQGRVFVVGGWIGRRLPEILELTSTAAGYQVVEAGRLPVGFSDNAVVATQSGLFAVGGTHHQFYRQIRVLRWSPETGEVEDLVLR